MQVLYVEQVKLQKPPLQKQKLLTVPGSELAG